MQLPKMPKVKVPMRVKNLKSKVKVPKVKDIKSKLYSAKLLGLVVKNSLAFKIRRRAFKRFKASDFDTVIVDMDGTLYDTDVNLEALEYTYKDGAKKYASIISKIVSGYSIEKALVEGNKFLKNKVGKKDFKKILKRVEPTIRVPLVKSLKDMQADGKTIVLATLSSKDFGEVLDDYLNEKLGFRFDYIIGTELEFNENGMISGFKSIVGTKDYVFEGIPVSSKLTAVKECLEKAGKEFDLKKTVLITDSYGDIDSAKMVVTVLIKPKKSTSAQKVSQRLGLADYIIPDTEFGLRFELNSLLINKNKSDFPDSSSD